jgi:hypothetical protein
MKFSNNVSGRSNYFARTLAAEVPYIIDYLSLSLLVSVSLSLILFFGLSFVFAVSLSSLQGNNGPVSWDILLCINGAIVSS